MNVVVRGLLRTPGLCSLIGSRLLTLYLVGRNSERRYSVPVAYLADGDDLLLGTSAGWRHKLRLGQPVAGWACRLTSLQQPPSACAVAPDLVMSFRSTREL